MPFMHRPVLINPIVVERNCGSCAFSSLASLSSLLTPATLPALLLAASRGDLRCRHKVLVVGFQRLCCLFLFHYYVHMAF